MQVTRYDRGKFGQARIDESTGFLRVPATVTRVGVFTYRKADGSEVRELRHPDEVFHPDALDGLRQAVVTLQHPIEEGRNVPINASNASKFQVGHSGDSVKVDGDLVGVPLTITHQDAIDSIQSGGPREVSCGYTAEVEAQAGVWEGHKYDAVQKNIRYNHIAVVDRGRAGPAVRLHIDAAEQIETNQKKDMEMELDKLPAELVARFDELKAQIKASEDLQNKCDALEGERDQLKAKIEELKADKLDQEKIDALVAERADLVAKVSEHCETKGVELFKLDSTGLRNFALKSAGIDVSDKSAAYVEARFDAWLETVEKTDRTAAQAGEVQAVAAEGRIDEDSILEERIAKATGKGK